MNRMVWCVFKAIALSMIFVFVWDMGFYLYRTYALNQRMEMLMSSLTKVVQENNYLPENEKEVYDTLFRNIADMMNGDKSKYDSDSEKTGSDYQFVNGFQWNYAKDSKGTINYANKVDDIMADVTDVKGKKYNRNILVRSMDKSACYGDIMLVYVSVNVNTPFWYFTTKTEDVSKTATNGKAYEIGDNSRSLTTWKRNVAYSNVTMDYVYYVPCMNYTSVTD